MTSTTKPFSLFDWIKCIVDTKQSWDSFNEEQYKVFNGYLIHRFLSMNSNYIELVNYVQGLNIKDNKKLYEIYCYFIPQTKRTYYPYIKSQTKKLNPEVSKYVSEYFECSQKEAEEYIGLMDIEWVKGILEAKGIDEKTIKKLVK